VVAYKVGRSEAGARSAVSHTGALAGSDAAYDAMFKQFGVIRAERYSDLLDLPLALSRGRTLKGPRVAIVTSTGGAASLLADAAGMLGLETPPPDAATAAKLEALAIEGATLDRNPIDITLAGVKPETFRTVLDIVMASPSYDAVTVVLGSSALREPETAGAPLRACAAMSEKPVVGFASPDAPQLVRTLNLAGVPTFGAPESCAAALAALLRTGKPTSVERASAATPVVPNDVRALLRPGALNEAESKQLFGRFGIPITREVVARTPDDAATAAKTFGGNVVVKALSRDLLHKSEAGGVAVDVAPADVARVCAEIAERFTAAKGGTPDGFLVQELVRGGVEIILGFHHDAQLGPVILLGMGGVAAELMRDTTMRLAPVSRDAARAMIDDLKTAALLKGYRGRPLADVEALTDAIIAFSNMVVVLAGDLQEAEINPLFVLPHGQGVVAADGVVIVKGAAAGPP
jgi:acyl-CoA synthetase (NDP forming)